MFNRAHNAWRNSEKLDDRNVPVIELLVLTLKEYFLPLVPNRQIQALQSASPLSFNASYHYLFPLGGGNLKPRGQHDEWVPPVN